MRERESNGDRETSKGRRGTECDKNEADMKGEGDTNHRGSCRRREQHQERSQQQRQQHKYQQPQQQQQQQQQPMQQHCM